MKTTSLVLGLTGSVLVLMWAVKMAFFGTDMLPASGTYFNPDLFVLFLAGILGLFGGLTGAAGSLLPVRSAELSGIMLFGAAVSGAIMFGTLITLFLLAHIYDADKYVILATAIISVLTLAASGVVSLKARHREPAVLKNENS